MAYSGNDAHSSPSQHSGPNDATYRIGRSKYTTTIDGERNFRSSRMPAILTLVRRRRECQRGRPRLDNNQGTPRQKLLGMPTCPIPTLDANIVAFRSVTPLSMPY